MSRVYCVLRSTLILAIGKDIPVSQSSMYMSSCFQLFYICTWKKSRKKPRSRPSPLVVITSNETVTNVTSDLFIK